MMMCAQFREDGIIFIISGVVDEDRGNRSGGRQVRMLIICAFHFSAQVPLT